MKPTPADFDYDLPPERIAQTPAEPRDASRLMVVHRDSGAIEHRLFRDIVEYIGPGDVLVVNDSRVRNARLFGEKATGGRVEILVLRPLTGGLWETLVSPGKRVPPGTRLFISSELEAEVLERTESGGRVVRFHCDAPLDDLLPRLGETPLPPYIHDRTSDPERYQTVYADRPGSAAAPTAGLHFTPELMDAIRDRGALFAGVTLHIGLDTFRPVKVDDLDAHVMHSEWFEIPESTAQLVNSVHAVERVSGRTGELVSGRVIAVGTTSVRALESSAVGGRVRPGPMETRLFLRPLPNRPAGAEFQVVDALITNFHLPRSTLLMLVSAFAGRERILAAYQEAVKEGYRFFSFGDAMMIA